MTANLFENSWPKFLFGAVLEVSGIPVCCLIAQTENMFCCQMYFRLYEMTPDFD